jgi:hypothetical protein
MVIHTCHPSYIADVTRIIVQAGLDKKVGPYLKLTKAKKGLGYGSS